MYRRLWNDPALDVESGLEEAEQDEAIVDRDDAVNMESVLYHCDATILVPNDLGHEPMKVGAVLDSGSGVTCISEKVAARLGVHFEGMQVTFPFEGRARACVADGREFQLVQPLVE